VIACLLCLIANGAKTDITADVSVAALLDQDFTDMCDHTALTPAELALHITPMIGSEWTDAAMTGWNLLCQILQSDFGNANHADFTDDSDMDVDVDEWPEDDMDCCDIENHFYVF